MEYGTADSRLDSVIYILQRQCYLRKGNRSRTAYPKPSVRNRFYQAHGGSLSMPVSAAAQARRLDREWERDRLRANGR